MLNKSPELKAQRGYVEPDSFVRLDGSEVLVKRDWAKRKRELWDRCGGRCEYSYFGCVFAERCRAQAHDPHHIKERWRGRDDRLSNLMALCRMHHRKVDERRIGGRKQRSQT